MRLLVDYFLDAHSAMRGICYKIAPALLKQFEAYAWPGNVRELKNFVEYGVCFSEGGLLSKELLEPRFALAAGSRCPDVQGALCGGRSPDAAHLENLLRRYGCSTEGKKAVARHMGISVATLYRRLKTISK